MLYVMEMTYLSLVSWSMLREPEYIQETVSRYILHRHSHQRQRESSLITPRSLQTACT